jgi:hypothetical protein
LPFGELSADAFGTLLEGLFFVEQTATGEEWTVTDGDGTVVTTVAAQADLQAAYPYVWDWFQPARLSYCSDITIHYPDPVNDDNLKTYEDATAPSPAESQPPLHEFLERFTVDYHGTGLATDEVFDRYAAWMNTPGQSKPGRATFAQALTQFEDIETVTRGQPPGQKVICDRAWRFPPALDR